VLRVQKRHRLVEGGGDQATPLQLRVLFVVVDLVDELTPGGVPGPLGILLLEGQVALLKLPIVRSLDVTHLSAVHHGAELLIAILVELQEAVVAHSTDPIQIGGVLANELEDVRGTVRQREAEHDWRQDHAQDLEEEELDFVWEEFQQLIAHLRQ
jgi:hypothetical protein